MHISNFVRYVIHEKVHIIMCSLHILIEHVLVLVHFSIYSVPTVLYHVKNCLNNSFYTKILIQRSSISSQISVRLLISILSMCL